MSEDSQNSAQNSNSESAEKADAQSANAEELLAQAEKFKNDYLYLRAEFENYKRHAIKERSEALKYGSERLIVDMLSVLDNFERALESQVTAESWQNFVKGVELTAKEFRGVMQKFGVQEVASLGQPFDPNLHEALSTEASSEVAEGCVLRVFKKPYKLHDKLIRPGQVVVAKAPQDKA
jgi:molecular chaperone GrpE